MRSGALLLVMLGGLAACDTAASQVDAGRDGATGVDARTPADAAEPDACIAAEACSVLPAYGDLGHVAGNAVQEGSIFWNGQVATPCTVESVSVGIGLVLGRGVFSAGFVNGTSVLQGEQLDRDTCATCVSLLVEPGADAPPLCYFATGGTLVLTSVEERLTGYLEAASFVQVDCTTWEAAGSCTTDIAYSSFDEPIIPAI